MHTEKKVGGHFICEADIPDALLVASCDAKNGDNCSNEPFKSAGYGILLVTKGSLSIKINFVEHRILQREILCIVPGDIYEIPNKPAASVLYSHFGKEYVRKTNIFLNLAKGYNIFSRQSAIKYSLTGSEYRLMHADILSLQTRLSIPKTTPFLEEIIHNSFLSIVYNLLLVNEKQKKLRNWTITTQEALTSRFLSMVSERFKSEKRVLHYARALRITSRHLSQVVKQVTGKSAGEHIDDFVIREAKLLLRSQVLNISEIAEALSFSDPSFFGKYFKKQTGLSPISFKKLNTLTG